MRPHAVARLILLCLAIVAASTDSALKVMHGVVHARDSHESVVHGLAADASERASVDVLDADADHFALHAAIAPRVLTHIAMVTSAIVGAPIVDGRTQRHALPRSNAQTAPPWVRTRTTQPRAPPLG